MGKRSGLRNNISHPSLVCHSVRESRGGREQYRRRKSYTDLRRYVCEREREGWKEGGRNKEKGKEGMMTLTEQENRSMTKW